MKKIQVLLSVVLAAALSGCGILSSPKYTEPKTYDIGLPARTESFPFTLAVQPFSSDGAGRYKMLFRTGDNQILADEFNRWGQSPAAMTTKYLRLAFAAADTDPMQAEYRLSGAVLSFECDRKDKIARLYVRYTITSTATEKVVRSGILKIDEPLKTGEDALSFAAAMERAAAELTARIAGILHELPSKPDKG